MIFNKADIEVFLKKYSDQKVVYCANPGNAGDAIIAHATYQLFEKLDIRAKIIRHTDIVSDQTIFYAGGGNLVEGKYLDAYIFLKNNHANNKQIVLLPHTVFGYHDLLLSLKNLTIICREKVSYEYLYSVGFPVDKLFLAHDMAFLFTPLDFSTFQQNGSGTANCFRTDFESTNAVEIPGDNIDISMSWNGELWDRPEFAKNVTYNLACYLSAFETIKTDRLHVAILGAVMGKRVILFSNNTYKIRAVYDYSMRERFNNVTFQDIAPQNEQMTRKPENIEKAKTDFEKETNLVKARNQIARLEIENQSLMKVFDSRSWRFTRPLRYIKRLFFSK